MNSYPVYQPAFYQTTCALHGSFYYPCYPPGPLMNQQATPSPEPARTLFGESSSCKMSLENPIELPEKEQVTREVNPHPLTSLTPAEPMPPKVKNSASDNFKTKVQPSRGLNNSTAKCQYDESDYSEIEGLEIQIKFAKLELAA